jgi:hypothetical protein
LSQIINIIEEAYDGRRAPRRDEIAGIMIHRGGLDLQTGVILGLDGLSISNIFTGKDPHYPSVAAATGYENPYTLFIGGHSEFDGLVWQALPLNEIGYHARRWSAPFIGICCIGDFRETAPTAAQMASLLDLLAGLCSAYAFDPYKAIRGHGEVQGGIKAANEPGACPGKLLDLNHVRYETEQVMKGRAWNGLQELGLVF